MIREAAGALVTLSLEDVLATTTPAGLRMIGRLERMASGRDAYRMLAGGLKAALRMASLAPFPELPVRSVKRSIALLDLVSDGVDALREELRDATIANQTLRVRLQQAERRAARLARS